MGACLYQMISAACEAYQSSLSIYLVYWNSHAVSVCLSIVLLASRQASSLARQTVRGFLHTSHSAKVDLD